MAGNDYTGKSQAFSYRKNAGGLNSTASAIALEDNESSDLLNVDFDILGSFHKRKGYTQLNTTAFNGGAAFNGLYYFPKSDGTSYLLGTCGSKLGVATAFTQAATPFTDRTGSITLTPGNNNHVSWATMLDTVIGTNGVDAPFQCTGNANATALTVPTGVTTADFVVVFQNYLMIANVTLSGVKQSSRIYWYEIDSISSVIDSSFRDVNKKDGQEITGLKVLGDTLVIFKKRSIWLCSFTGDSDIPFIFSQSRSSVGCVSGQSIQEVENGLVFLSEDGFYYFDGNNSFKTSQRILKTMLDLNRARYENCTSIYYYTKNRYISSFTSGGAATHDTNICWDSFNNAFSVYDGLNANCYARVYSLGKELIFFGDYSGFVYQMDNGDSDYPSGTETAIEFYYYTKWFDFNDLQSKKAVPKFSIYYQNSEATLTFVYSYNLNTGDEYTQSFSLSGGGAVYGSAVYGTDVYGGEGGNAVKRHLTGRGETIRFGFKNAVKGEGIVIEGFGAYPNLETDVK